MRHAGALLCCVSLAACQQAANPYSEQSIPYPPAPAAAADNFDRSNYPPPQRDFALYQSWAWRNGQLPEGSGWVSRQLFSDSISASLDQRGLRPAQGNAAPGLLVSARVETAEVEINEPPRVGGLYGYGPYGDGYGAGIGGPLNDTWHVLRVQIDLFDARSGQPVWSGNAARVSAMGEDQRSQTLREVVAQTLKSLPAN